MLAASAKTDFLPAKWAIQRGRDHHLDGLRGVAALVVVFEHMSALLPVADWRFGPGLGWEAVAALVSFPFRAGNFAVYIFFVMSGIVVAKAARGKPWPLSLVARYCRLTLPMLAASLLAWALLSLYPDEMPRISLFKANYWTTNLYQFGAPTLWQAVSEAMFGAYATLPKPLVNPVLWSMRIELWGSLGIFTFYRFTRAAWRPYVLAGIAVLLSVSGAWAYLSFAIGIALSELADRDQIKANDTAGLAMMAGGIIIAAMAPLSAFRYYSRLAAPIVGFEVDLKILVCTIGATLLVGGVILSEKSQSFLTSRVPQFLGMVSYSLYLTHMPILYTIFAAWYLSAGVPHTPLFLCVWTAAFLVVAIPTAYGLTIIADRPATRLTKLRRTTT
jgi:peptidoglycan/LPS O-acetylase OafA/YrhL